MFDVNKYLDLKIDKEDVATPNKKRSEREREYAREYYRKNREKVLEHNKKWNLENPEKQKIIRQRYRKTDKFNNDVNLLRKRLIASFRRVLKDGTSKNKSFKLLPYTSKDLYEHLIVTMPLSLSIEECHIDHIKPICSFDPEKLADPSSKEFQECWSLDNLRLIFATDNMRKGREEDLLLKFKKNTTNYCVESK